MSAPWICTGLTSKLSGRLAPLVGGRGGGKRTLAQAGGKNPEKLGEALAMAPQVVKELLG